MPQLFPMNWHLLIPFFLSIFIISSTLIYFNYTPVHHAISTKLMMISKNWKW
nr:ATP synthase F0 subunit 8 [Alectorobius spheniscus]